jgi:hypothetical protein
MTWLMMNWKLGLLALAIAFAGIQTLRLQAETAKKELAESDLRNYKRLAEVVATTAKTQSDNALKEAKREYEIQKAAVEKTAFANAKARFGACPALGSIRLPALPAPSGGAETRVPEGPGELQEPERVAVDRAFIDACGNDVAYIKAVNVWRESVGLPISKE